MLVRGVCMIRPALDENLSRSSQCCPIPLSYLLYFSRQKSSKKIKGKNHFQLRGREQKRIKKNFLCVVQRRAMGSVHGAGLQPLVLRLVWGKPGSFGHPT